MNTNELAVSCQEYLVVLVLTSFVFAEIAKVVLSKAVEIARGCVTRNIGLLEGGDSSNTPATESGIVDWLGWLLLKVAMVGLALEIEILVG